MAASAKPTTYVALLRGINVGGNNGIRMADLRSLFEAQGLTEVSTYIASGNVLFRATEKDAAALARRLEAALAKRFSYDSKLVLVPHTRLRTIVEKAPRGFGAKPEQYRYDVVFLRAPLTGAKAMKEVPLNPEVDEAHASRHAIYYARADKDITRSRLSRIVALPIYKDMTIRNWNTTTKLLALMDDLP